MIHFITFGDKENYYNAALRLASQIQESELFDSFEAYNEDSLLSKYPSFDKHLEFINNNKSKGFGYWVWKPFLIKNKLKELNNNDLLVYFDAGCEVNMNAKDRLKLYLDYAYKNDFMGFGVETEIGYTKIELLQRLGVNNTGFLNSKQCQSGLLFIKKCNKTIKLVDDWYDLSIENNYINLINTTDMSIQNKEFKVHRNDQSILSLLIKINRFKFIEDETWKSPLWHINGKDIPLWAIRNNKKDLSIFNIYLNYSVKLRHFKQIKVGTVGAYNSDCVLFNYLIKIINPDINIIWENSDDCDIILKGHKYPPIYFTNKVKPFVYFSGEPFNVPLENGIEKYIEFGTLLEGNENNPNFHHIPFATFSLKCLYNNILYTNENPDNKENYLNNLLEIGKDNNNFDNLYLERIYKNKNRKYLCAWCASKTSDFRDKLFNTLVEKDISKTVHSLGKQYGNYPETNRKIPGQNWNDLALTKQYSDYYFVLAVENCVKKGYVTEKILNAFYSGAIPVYYGDRSVFDYFNKEAFIYINDFNSIEECVDYIINLPLHKIQDMMNKPIFKENKLHDKIKLNHYPPSNYYKKISLALEKLLDNNNIKLNV